MNPRTVGLLHTSVKKQAHPQKKTIKRLDFDFHQELALSSRNKHFNSAFPAVQQRLQDAGQNPEETASPLWELQSGARLL